MKNISSLSGLLYAASINMQTLPVLVDISSGFTGLQQVGGALKIDGLPKPVNITFASLVLVGDMLQLSNMLTVTKLSFPKLTNTDGLTLLYLGCSTLNNAFPALVTMDSCEFNHLELLQNFGTFQNVTNVTNYMTFLVCISLHLRLNLSFFLPLPPQPTNQQPTCCCCV